MAKMKKIIEQCPACNGSGVYSGFAEAKGTAVICQQCDGQGWSEYQYKPFEGRKKKRGIKTVSLGRGTSLMSGVGADKRRAWTYKEFEQKFPVKKPRR